MDYHPGDVTGYGYEPLLAPDGSELAVLTEPEDRTWSRDLAPVVTELNCVWGWVTEAQDRAERAEAEAGRWQDISRDYQVKFVEQAERATQAEAEVERLRAALTEERRRVRWALCALPGGCCHWPQYRLDMEYPSDPHAPVDEVALAAFRQAWAQKHKSEQED